MLIYITATLRCKFKIFKGVDLMKTSIKKIVTTILSSAMFFSRLAPSAVAMKYYFDIQTGQIVSEDELDPNDFTVLNGQTMSGRYTLYVTHSTSNGHEITRLATDNTIFISKKGNNGRRANVYRPGNYSDDEVIPLATVPETSTESSEEKAPTKKSKIQTEEKRKDATKPKKNLQNKKTKENNEILLSVIEELSNVEGPKVCGTYLRTYFVKGQKNLCESNSREALSKALDILENFSQTTGIMLSDNAKIVFIGAYTTQPKSSVLSALNYIQESANERDGYGEFFSNDDKTQIKALCEYVKSNQELITL